VRLAKYAVLFVLGASAPLARGDDIQWGLNHELNDAFVLALGAAYFRLNGQAQKNSTTGGLGTLIDLQDTLGLSQEAIGPYASFRWRMSERWRLEASYVWISESGSKSINQDIHWDDVVYPINAELSSKFNFSDFRTSVGYSFYKTSDKELGVALGLHVLSYQLSLSSLNQGTEAGDVLAPLPVLSGYGGFALDEQWSVTARLDWLSLTYQQYHGGITSMRFDLLYQPFQHVGFGLGWTGLNVNFQATSGHFVGKLQQNFQGPELFVTASF
jgi:hypothetical protein